MAAVTQSDIEVFKTSISGVDLRAGYRVLSKYLSNETDTIKLKQYHPDFTTLIGSGPTHSLLISSASTSRNPFFHDACVYLPAHDELYVTSNLLQSTSSSQLPIVLISKINLTRSTATDTALPSLVGDVTAAGWQKLRPPPNMPMPAGGAAYEKGIVFCSQGARSPDSGGLVYMPRGKPPIPLITSFGGRPFNSPFKVAVARDGALWFTDPSVGSEAEIRPPPRLPNHVYRFDPTSGVLRVVADGLGRPGGLCFDPEEETVYICDMDAAKAEEDLELAKAATIYAYDVITRSGQVFLANKRIFAFTMKGVPRVVHCDGMGNVYAACGDGVEVWSPGGTPLGLVEVPGGCSNFCFGKDGELFLCAQQTLWRLQLGGVRDAHMDG